MTYLRVWGLKSIKSSFTTKRWLHLIHLKICFNRLNIFHYYWCLSKNIWFLTWFLNHIILQTRAFIIYDFSPFVLNFVLNDLSIRLLKFIKFRFLLVLFHFEFFFNFLSFSSDSFFFTSLFLFLTPLLFFFSSLLFFHLLLKDILEFILLWFLTLFLNLLITTYSQRIFRFRIFERVIFIHLHTNLRFRCSDLWIIVEVLIRRLQHRICY